ncbi:putative glycosyl hydrolase, family 18 [Lophiotrema nucula]|uniref:chitinase n=1 Tax=Lophiotrema nucula TaxID=690887 RepID=A0A6A5ZNC7_9PLEO|nr:putative glycosyl hydrolase, family 18 [Lophiotrema nucula]
MYISTALILCVAAAGALAAFNSNSKSNLAIYWGQNSANQATSQDRLSVYCQSSDVDIIIMSFLIQINGAGGEPVLNFANQIDDKKGCKLLPGTALWQCPEIEADIQDCQTKYGKTVLLSIGGATYNEGFASEQAAVDAANKVWNTFGPPQNTQSLRPFGNAFVNGFDFDFEGVIPNAAPFAAELRRLIDSCTSQTKQFFYLSAAPQCPFPDYFGKDILDNVALDFLMIQFYNNYCGVSGFVAGQEAQPNFNLNIWDQWARTQAKNTNTRLLVGVPANLGAGAGYVDSNALARVIEYSRGFEKFGGVMMWDASQAWANGNFVGDVKSKLRDRVSRPRRHSRHEGGVGV